MVIQPIELKHPAVNVDNNPAKIPLIIQIYEVILVTSHFRCPFEPSFVSVKNMFLTDDRISG